MAPACQWASSGSPADRGARRGQRSVYARFVGPMNDRRGAPNSGVRVAWRRGACGEGLVLVLAAVVLGFLWWSGRDAGDGVVGFRLDDAWIHMVYGREIARHGYLAYNPGVPATGSTAPLWAYWLGVLHLVVGSSHITALVIATYVTNAMLWLGVVWLGMRLARTLGATLPLALGSGVCLGFATPVAATVYSGMEIVLCALLLLAGAQALLRGHPTRAGFGFALACLTRPESAVCALLGGLWLLFIASGKGPDGQALPWRSRFFAVLRYAAPLCLLGALAFGFNLAVSGRPLPATFYLKAQSGRFSLPQCWSRLFADLLGQVPMFGAPVIWLVALALLLPRPWPGRRAALLVFLLGISYALANVLVVPPIDPPAFYHLRYVLPAVPLLVVALFAASGEIVPRRYERLARVVPAVLCMATAIAGALSIGALSRHLHSDTRNINQLQRRLGQWVETHVPRDAWIATNDAGAVRYFSRRPALDMMGLNTPRLLWDPDNFARRHPVHVAVIMPAWFGIVEKIPLRILASATTDPYTVTSNPAMRMQLILEYGAKAPAPVPVAFHGVRDVSLSMVPDWSHPVALPADSAPPQPNPRSATAVQP